MMGEGVTGGEGVASGGGMLGPPAKATQEAGIAAVGFKRMADAR
jgi:hypothetical protein